MARLVYLGTPDVAVEPLRALVGAGHEVATVVSRPDRRRGRGGALAPSPVKAEAERLGLEVTDRLDGIADLGAEMGVVVAYGRIIPASLLERVPMVNLHFSLLPRWRGAAPVERAVLAGDTRTGVSLMAVEAGLDTGPVYAHEPVAIGPDESARQLAGRLATVGARLLTDHLAGGVAGLPVPRPQQGTPTYAEKIRPEERELHWSLPAVVLHRVVRVGRAWTLFRGHRLLVVETVVGPVPAGGMQDPGEDAGRIDGDLVVAGEGSRLRLVTVQPEGRRPMAAAEWLRGVRPEPGERLGGSQGAHGGR